MSKKPAGQKIPEDQELEPAEHPLDQLGELPRSYGIDTIFLVAQEPHWLFTYWDLDISLHPGGKTFLRILRAGELENEIEVFFETRNWYVPVNVADAPYRVEIGYYRGSQWHTLAASAEVRTPPDRISESGDFEYATIPLHLSFQRLMENIQTAISDGETLIQALSRLQQDGRLLDFSSLADFPEGSDERTVFEALLGKPLLEELSKGSISSEELGQKIQEHLAERLSSAATSELLARHQWGAAESSLFSALSHIAATSSGNHLALSSWAAAALTSWAAAAGGSWTTAPGSSWGGAALSSWGPESLTSWLQAASSSWNTAPFSSWSEQAFSSWSHGAQTSWTHGATSSWGGSETMGSHGAVERNFFMHVNAEVIFYGGTHPQARVTIDGKPVTLHPDGSFRHHFIFPDGTYEIPITATSPDGLETRSATLRFHRDTARSGEVGHSAQPPLNPPLGAKP